MHIYILYDSAGTVLYVGKTARLKRRLVEHSTLQAWREQIARHESYEIHDHAAEVEEIRLIDELKPLYNCVHSTSSGLITIEDIERHYGMRLVDAVGEMGMSPSMAKSMRKKGISPHTHARILRCGVRPYTCDNNP